MSLNQLFDTFIGGNSNAASTGGAEQGNANAGASGIAGLANTIPGGLIGGLAAGGLLGALVGNKKMRKKASKLAGGAVGIGGGALLGAVAFKAYQSWQSGGTAPAGAAPSAQTDTQAPARPVTPISSGGAIPMAQLQKFDPVATKAADGQPFQVSLIKAMIAAANADGHIDAKEQSAIFEAVNKMDLEAADKALVFDTLQKPPSVDTVASYANGLEQASEIYLVSNLAIDPDDLRERAYLDQLAEKLSLPKELAQHLENQVSGQSA